VIPAADRSNERLSNDRFSAGQRSRRLARSEPDRSESLGVASAGGLEGPRADCIPA
jgi:hypothetical protein